MLNLCFDCDDTLYNLSWPFIQTMKKFFPEVNEETYDMEKMYLDYRHHGDVIYDLFVDGNITPDDSGILRIVKLCKQYGLHIDVMDAWEFQSAYKDFQYKIQMPEILYNFLKNYPGKKAVISNGQSEHQHRKLASLKAAEVIDPDHIFVSQDLGYHKPDVRTFEEAFRRMGEDLHDWYYIGDSYHHDMEGAKKAGMKTIHLNRHHNVEGPCADYVVYDEKELIDLINRLNKEAE